MSENSLKKDEENTEKNITGTSWVTAKAVIGALLVLVLSCLSCLGLSRYVRNRTAEELAESEREKALSAAEAMAEVLHDEEQQREIYYTHLRRSADLMTDMLMRFVDEDVYDGPETFSDSLVIRIENGRVQWPVGFRDGDIELPGNFPEGIEGDLFFANVNDGDETRGAAVIVRQLCTDTWYLEYTFTDEETEFLRVNVSAEEQFEAIEGVSGGWAVIVDPDSPGRVRWNSFDFPQETIEEVLEAAKDGDAMTGEDGSLFHAVRTDLENGQTVLFMMPREAQPLGGAGDAVTVSLLIFLILTALYVFLIATERMAFFHTLTKPQAARYNPGAMRRRTAAAGGVCMILLFAAALMIHAAGGLYSQSREAYEGLSSYSDGIDLLSERTAESSREEQEWVEFYGQRIGVMLGTYPELLSDVRLAMMNESIGTEYIMVFDEEGNEIACSSDYIGYSLGTKADEPLYVFRKITHGLQTLTLEAGEDFILGKDTVLTGARFEREEGYGVVLISSDAAAISVIDPKKTEERLMCAAAGDTSLIFSLNEEKTAIQSSSAFYYDGADIMTAGLDEQVLKETEMCRFSLFGLDCYGSSKVIQNRLHYYAVSRTDHLKAALPFALLSTLCALVSFAVLAVYMLWGYSQKKFETLAQIGSEAVRGSSIDVITPDGRIKRTRDPSKRWSLSASSWKDLLPENKTAAVLQVILAVYLGVLMYILWSTADRVDSLLTYLMGGTWDRNFNLFAAEASILLICAVALGLMLVKILIRLLCTWLDTKGETILRLFYNLLEYVAVFTTLFVCFRNFGIDTSALLTTMGLLSLAVSIGARDLVADVIAGITIVFEGDYQVGDIVEIDGYRGRVQEIGVRSTKIMGMGDNIKIVNNRDVRNVINTTRFNSWYAMNLNISSSFDINKLEEILDKELPEIRKRLKKVISGPVYKGVESIGKDSFKITILTECREEDFRWVQRQVNREIRLLFDREGIPII